MDEPTTVPTVEMSLGALSDTLLRTIDDLTAAHGTLEMARESHPEGDEAYARRVIAAATRAVDELKHVEEALVVVVRTIEGRS
jgi:hypothetical protein